MPIPEKRDLKRFCELDGWEETSATSPDHDRYVKRLDDGRVLRTKVSRGRGPVCGDPRLWHRIWRHQLELDHEEEFWEVLNSRRPASRSATSPEPPAKQQRMPHWLFEFLVAQSGLSEDEVLALTEDEAMEAYLRLVSRQ